ncbi:MAG: hypothetical protein Q4B01_08610 [Eubacteriales bacterium]|nr:hypothetical protein [Eubacteriales bacterium]
MNKIINTLSIRGRVTYLIMCFETYVTAKYPERNWAPVSDRMWKICDDSDYIDNSAYRYMEIVPEYLYEFDNYKDAEFDYLTEDEYKQFISIIPSGSQDPDLEIIMHSIYNIAMECAYGSAIKYLPNTIPYIEAAEKCMKKASLPLPDLSRLAHLTDPEHQWGEQFDGRYLSIILKGK